MDKHKTPKTNKNTSWIELGIIDIFHNIEAYSGTQCLLIFIPQVLPATWHLQPPRWLLRLEAWFLSSLHTPSLEQVLEICSTVRARWLMPVIPALWEVKASGSPVVRSSRLAWPTWWNPVSNKNTKTSWVWWWVPVVLRIAWTRKADVIVNRDCATAFQPEWQSKTPSQKKKKKKEVRGLLWPRISLIWD